MPTHSDTNGMGAQMLAETYSVGPFHTGGGGWGRGALALRPRMFDAGSYTVP